MVHEQKMPPSFFLKLFRWYCHPRLHSHVEGDLLEVYGARRKKLGKFKADLWFALDVLMLFRPGIIRPSEGYQKLNSYGMYKSYVKVGWRNMLRNRGYSIINISGLAVGMAAAILNGLWIWHEVSYDTYFDNYDRIALVAEEGNDPRRGTWLSSTMTYPLSTALKTNYSQHFKRIARSTWSTDNIIISGETKLSAKGMYVEPDFPEMFSFHMISGTRTSLGEPHTIMISVALAHRLFGDDDPMNKIVSLSINTKVDVRVGGVYEDFPDNTKLDGVQFFGAWSLYETDNTWIGARALTDWRNHFFKLYVELPEENSFEGTAVLVKNALQFAPEDQKDAELQGRHLQLYPMSRWHLHPEFVRGGQMSPIFLLKLVGTVGIFILLLACINFVNLSTARAERRAKEIGIRKTIGSVRLQLIQQFFSESIMIVFIAFVAALLLTYACLPGFNIIASKQIVMPWMNLRFWLASISFVLLTGLLAGTWPALHLSSFNPVKALKGVWNGGRFQATPRKILVVFQFSISVVLIIGTIIVYRQIRHVKDRPVGYDREGLIVVRKKNAEFDGKYHILRNELKNSGAVLEVSESMGSMAEIASGNDGWNWKGRDPNFNKSFATLAVSHLHGKTVGWQFVQGRDFDVENAGDSSGLVINESALQVMQLVNPIGESVTWTWWMDNRMMDYKIIGVVKDMVMDSPYAPALPTVFYLKGFNGMPTVINIRVNPAVSMSEALPKIEEVFNKVIPTVPFEYRFADEEYAAKFGKEERIGILAGIFSFIAVSISCLGLLGLSAFVAEQRTKEIGIRKVLGATVADVWQMLSRDFVLLVLVSCVVAAPLAYYLLLSWLQNFSYRMEISLWIFVATGIGAVVLTLGMVSFQAIKTAMMNPVKSLRSE